MGELGNAALCGSADGNGRLAVAVGSTANIVPPTCAVSWNYCTNVVILTATQSAAPRSA
jgi:hypothetical protein